MAQAEIHEVLGIDKEKLFAAVTRYEDYPKFVDGVKAVKVERKGPGKARVTYNVSIMKDIHYVLEHTEDAEKGRVDWNLIESDAMKKNIGFWEIKAAGPGKCDVRYGIEVEFKFPIPGFVLNKLVKGTLPSMLRSFEKQAKSTL